MPISNRPESSQTIYAQVVVRPDNGNSLLNSSVLIDSKNVAQFHVASDRIELVVRKLKEAGFEVLSSGKIAITIAGLPEVFERVFQTTLETVERPVIKELGQNALGTFFNAIDCKPFGEIDVSHTSWHQFLDGVAINEPVYYFQSRLPSPIPPSVPKRYLSVPEGVAKGLNAHLAHQQGITGKGIHVVMVDSGWYRHPYFVQYNYNVNVHLASGSSDRNVDLTGHGTGESANLLAIAPDIKLTMVKADVALYGKGKNVNAVGALREAIALKPDIISCSWGTDERTRDLSPYNRVLAATVAEAIHQGIIVIFSAGNGQYGFPAQHPEVIAAGGAYLHLNGSLQGKIEASSYASSFISPIYGDRQIPDVCGLVGNLPHGSYIMLPVSPNSLVDQQLAVRDDGTEAIDGWAAFSGTSAAAPQLAGICALMKQVNRGLSPAQARQILQRTARDVVDGFSNPATSGASARAGPDLATGHGLADAYKAVNTAKSLTHDKCCDNCASSSSQNFSTTSQNPLPKKVSKPMASEFPKLKKNIEQVQWKLNERFGELLKELSIDEDVELILNESNFISISPLNKSANVLRKVLDDCFDKKSGKIAEFHEISEEHIYAAKGLLKLGKYPETAVNFLTEILGFSLKDPKKRDRGKTPWTDDEKKDFKAIKKLASDALSDLSDTIIEQTSSATMFGCNMDDCSTRERNGRICYVGENCTCSPKC
jgi:subtilisin family serine protease